MYRKLETNVLIVGKSGVGKSSLLNYVFGENVMATGSGKPVTGKGIFTERLSISEDFIINLSDTWGLEANKSTEWEELIVEELKKHDCDRIDQWFHTIFFCISAKASRVEEFEKKIIKMLVSTGNKVIIVLTHADVNNVDKAIEEINKELNKIGIVNENIIRVCSVGKKLLSGKTTKPFGKQEVIQTIKGNLWETICRKMYRVINRMIDEHLDRWYLNSCTYVNKEIKLYNSQSNKKLDEIAIYVQNLLISDLGYLTELINKKYDEVMQYYENLSERYNEIGIRMNSTKKFNYTFNFKLEIKEIIIENIKQAINFIFPAGFIIQKQEFFRFNSISKKRKSEISHYLKQTRDNISIEMKMENGRHTKNMLRY